MRELTRENTLQRLVAQNLEPPRLKSNSTFVDGIVVGIGFAALIGTIIFLICL